MVNVISLPVFVLLVAGLLIALILASREAVTVKA